MFIKSLPSDGDCLFQILSFGDKFECLLGQKSDVQTLEYNQENIDLAMKSIEQFRANKGGTWILYPLKEAVQIHHPQGYEKHIFLLTDGMTMGKSACINVLR